MSSTDERGPARLLAIVTELAIAEVEAPVVGDIERLIVGRATRGTPGRTASAAAWSEPVSDCSPIRGHTM